jgi:hypothetical protein
VSNVVLSPDSEFQTSGKRKERDSAMFEFAADNPVSRQSEAVAIKGERLLKVGNADSQHGNP